MWILLYPFAEIYAFYKFAELYSFWDGVLFLVTSAALGAVLISLVGRSVFQNLQADLNQGKSPANKIVHRVCILIAGILFIIPGFISDFFAVLLVLPGTRHLIIVYFKARFFKGIQNGNMRFFSMGSMGNFSQNSQRPPERDAQIVDVTPIEITHERIKGD